MITFCLISFTALYVNDSCICTIQAVAVIYDAVICDVGIHKSVPMLVMEKVETSLSSLLLDVGDMVTMRERIDLAFGVVSAIHVQYFHKHLRVAHG